jgi:hypothetical protein
MSFPKRYIVKPLIPDETVLALKRKLLFSQERRLKKE